MSNVSFTKHTPLQRTLHPTGPIPDTYCISTLACNINPTIPHNIIQKFPAQFFGTDTTTAIDQCGILFIPIRPATTGTSPYQYHRPSQWSHSLALPTLYHQS